MDSMGGPSCMGVASGGGAYSFGESVGALIELDREMKEVLGRLERFDIPRKDESVPGFVSRGALRNYRRGLEGWAKERVARAQSLAEREHIMVFACKVVTPERIGELLERAENLFSIDRRNDRCFGRVRGDAAVFHDNFQAAIFWVAVETDYRQIPVNKLEAHYPGIKEYCAQHVLPAIGRLADLSSFCDGSA